MTSWHVKIVINLLMIGVLTACGTQATNTPPVSESTEPAAVPTQSVTDAQSPTDTSIPVSATEITATQALIQGATVSFANDVLPLLESRCRNCHGGNKTEEGLILLSYADVMEGSDNGPVVNPGHADNSLLVELLIEQKMPKRGPKLTSPQIRLIIDWINQGALEN